MKTLFKIILTILLVVLVVVGLLGATGNLGNFQDGMRDIIDDIKNSFDNDENNKPNENSDSMLTVSECTATLEYNLSRGYYYSLSPNTSYSFTIDSADSFGSEDIDLSYRLDAFGQVYLWDCYSSDSGTWVNTSEARLCSLSSIMDRFVQSVSIDQNVITLKTGYRPLANSYSSTHPDTTDNYTVYVDRFVEEINPTTIEPNIEPDNEYAAYNAVRISSYVFYVIVTDSISGVEKCLPFWMPCAFYDYDPY